MSTTGHELEGINVQGLKASLQKFKDDCFEDVAFMGEDDGSEVIADFDPQADSLWKKAQVLSNAEKVQVQQNIGVREWLNNLTGEKFASVTATDQTSAVTDLLPATGATDTVYRVGKWDGSAYNEEYYSDYAWDGSAYVQLNKKSIVGEVFDISEYHAGQKYDDLADALGTNGANVPEGLRKGGMSVKFVSNSDNKYVQARCMAQNFTTNTAQWQCVEKSLIKEDSNLITSTGINRRILGVINKLQNNLPFNDIVKFKGRLDVTNSKIIVGNTVYDNNDADTFLLYSVSAGDTITINGNPTNQTAIAFLNSFDFNYPDDYTPVFSSGETGFRTIRFIYNQPLDIVVPDGCTILLVARAISWNNNTPDIFKINGRNMMADKFDEVLIKCEQTLSNEEKAQVQENIGLEKEVVPTENSTKLITSGGVFMMGSKLDGSYKYIISGTATQGQQVNIRNIADRYPAGTKMKFKFTCDSGVFKNNRYNIYSKNGKVMLKTIENFSNWVADTDYIGYFTNDATYNDWGLYIPAENVLSNGNFILEIYPYYYNSLDYLASEKELNADDKNTTNYILFQELKKRTSGYNVSLMFPTGGIDGTNKYTLSGAIAQIPSSPNQRIEGMSITFIDGETNKWVKWRKVIPGTFTNTDNWKNEDVAEVNAYKHPFDGKKLVTLCDSLGNLSQWQTRLSQLTGAIYDSAKNNNHYSYGGTQTLNESNYCGQARAKMLVDEGLITPDVIIIENVNDSAAPNGNITDEPFFMNSRKQLNVPTQSSAADAETYWTNNFATIVSGETPAVGSVLGVPYAIDNAIKLTITHVPTSNGNVDITLSGMQEVQAISVVTTDTIQDILDKILEYQWFGYTVKQDGDDSVIFSPMSTGTKTITISYHSTGVTGTTLTGQSGVNYKWKYFYSFDVNDWTTAAKWVDSISRIAAWKGLVEYLFTNFPNALIYWLMPKTYNMDYTAAEWLRADGSIDYDKVVTQKNYASSLFSAQISFCDRYQIPYIDIRNESCITPANIATFIKPSNVHPKEAGYLRWADVIAKMTS